MASDPFASIRKAGEGSPSTFDTSAPEHLEHATSAPVFHKKPQISAVAHPEHLEHLQIGVSTGEGETAATWCDRRDPLPPKPALNVPNFRHADYEMVPKRWRLGLRSLNETPCPSWFEAGWWTQYVMDALCFAMAWGNEAVEKGWSVGSLFGGCADLGTISLIADLGGHRVVSLWSDDCGRQFAGIKTPTGWRCHRRMMPDDAPLLWDVDPRTIKETTV